MLIFKNECSKCEQMQERHLGVPLARIAMNWWSPDREHYGSMRF